MKTRRQRVQLIKCTALFIDETSLVTEAKKNEVEEIERRLQLNPKFKHRNDRYYEVAYYARIGMSYLTVQLFNRRNDS